MATRTLKIDSKVTIKHNGEKGIITGINNGKYLVGKLKLPYSASELIAEKQTPSGKKTGSINQVSAPQSKLNAIYSILRREWMPHNKTCVAHFAGCTRKATEVHHMYKRSGFWLIIVKLWMPLCRSCHRHATKNSRAAIDAGVSVSRLQDIPYSFTKHELNLMKLHNVSPPV
jgi:hypothetical protein